MANEVSGGVEFYVDVDTSKAICINQKLLTRKPRRLRSHLRALILR